MTRRHSRYGSITAGEAAARLERFRQLWGEHDLNSILKDIRALLEPYRKGKGQPLDFKEIPVEEMYRGHVFSDRPPMLTFRNYLLLVEVAAMDV